MTVKARVSHLRYGLAYIETYNIADNAIIEIKDLGKDEEICIDSNGKFINSASPDCKMALHLEDRNPDGDFPPFWVKIIKGCY